MKQHGVVMLVALLPHTRTGGTAAPTSTFYFFFLSLLFYYYIPLTNNEQQLCNTLKEPTVTPQ